MISFVLNRFSAGVIHVEFAIPAIPSDVKRYRRFAGPDSQVVSHGDSTGNVRATGAFGESGIPDPGFICPQPRRWPARVNFVMLMLIRKLSCLSFTPTH
jgi:hypothetical protein